MTGDGTRGEVAADEGWEAPLRELEPAEEVEASEAMEVLVRSVRMGGVRMPDEAGEEARDSTASTTRASGMEGERATP